MSAVPQSLPDRAYESKAFGLWQAMLDESRGRRVIDLGRLRPGTLMHFSERHINLDVVAFDWRRVVNARRDENGDPSPQAVAKALTGQLPGLDTGGCVAGVLCWDLPNYLERSELEQLGDWLAHYCASGAVAFVALQTRTNMPDGPASYQVLDHNRLTVEVPGGEMPAPMYSHNDLKRVWPDFDVVRSFLLQDGRQEYVLKRY